MRYEHNKYTIHPKRGNTIRHEDVIGKKFGLLTAISHAGYKRNQEQILCKCDCGKEKVIDYYKLISGHNTSCGDRIHKIKYDLTGKRFERLVAIRPYFKKGSDGALWECKCDCGNTAIVSAHNLMRSGGTKSCGCLKKERNERKESKTRLYKIWQNMKNRCYNSLVPAYKHYGGRGILVCDEWLKYDNFKQWALANGYNDKLTIERINVNGNYSPENCKWITMKTQCINKRTTLLCFYKGDILALKEVADITGLKYDNLHYHYHNNNLDEYLRSKGF